MSKPSLLVPTKNRPDLLRRCLDSCFAQTMPCEVVVVDASDQRTNWIDTLPTGPHELLYHHLPRDAGFLPTWYLCAALARGEFVHYALDDDWIEPNFMERTVDALMRDDVGVVLTQAVVHFDDGSTQVNLSVLPAQDMLLPSGFVIGALMNMPLTITPACATMRRLDVLNDLPVGRVPGTQRTETSHDGRTNCADTYMMLSVLASRPHVQWIAAPLAHLGAHADAFTIEALNDATKGRALIEQYAAVKMAWTRAAR